MAAVLTTLDGNEAVASVAYRCNEVIAIYPITPASPMGEWADVWAAAQVPNLWNDVPTIVEMQSEAGAAAAVHGALQAGALATTFTASQGVLLMIPTMYKIAGELTPAVFHVAARALATQALSIFCDHGDVMATRATGFALLASGSVQEAMDFAAIAQAATLESRIPFLHFFDGFRTSHEVSSVVPLADATLRALLDEALIRQHRGRALSPEHPVVRGTTHNPDIAFQAREAASPYHAACAAITQRAMDRFAALTGRTYRLYEYHGAADAARVLVLMGSGAEAAHETVDALNRRGARVGVVKVRLYRPFDARRFAEALPATTRAVAVLDRTKEPGSLGEPLYLDCLAALHEARARGWGTLPALPRVLGGRYGLASKEFTPAMIAGVLAHLDDPSAHNHFTVGIDDDATHCSIAYDPQFDIEADDVTRALFYGLGSDGTVGANKNSIKIIGAQPGRYAQGYFVYDSKKAGAVTVSHLRFGPRPIRSTYLVRHAHFVACHHWGLLERHDVLQHLMPGGTFLLNSPYPAAAVWDHLPGAVREQLVRNRLRFHVVDASAVARASGLDEHINTVMQMCFFALSNVLPRDAARAAIKESIRHSYRDQGTEVIERNCAAVDHALARLCEVSAPAAVEVGAVAPSPAVPPEASPFVRAVTAPLIAGAGDALPVSAVPADGTYPSGTARWEKRNLAVEIPVWDAPVCIQCGKCTMVCPHSALRLNVYAAEHLRGAPPTFQSTAARDREWQGLHYTIQVAPEDCTGCGICVDVCPAQSKSAPARKALALQPQAPLRAAERENWDFFRTIPALDRRRVKVTAIRQQQVLEPLFEFPGACAGCGETPYIKLVTQLFGDRAVVANATGCSSIYGGNLPTTPWSCNAEGRGPAWCNSLFEDNAEFGFGLRLSIDQQQQCARALVTGLTAVIGDELAGTILHAAQRDEAEIHAQRERVARLKERLCDAAGADARRLLALADTLVKRSVWIIGGDGWAYDIGFGGLDHVLASGRNVNVLVLDTEVYSNTGGQMSKATPRAAVAKFAATGKTAPKKDLGLIAMTYGNVYVARVALGAKDEQTLKAFLEAEAYDGPSLIIAYSHCVAHGIDMHTALRNHKAAVDAGQWLLYRFNPARAARGENPLQLDVPAPKIPLRDYLQRENRFRLLAESNPARAAELFAQAQHDVEARWRLYAYLAAHKPDADS